MMAKASDYTRATDMDAQMTQRNKKYGKSFSIDVWEAKHQEHIKNIVFFMQIPSVIAGCNLTISVEI